MKKLSPTEHLAALTVLVPGAIGLLIVTRTLAAYWQRDLMASVVAGTMALVLALGLIELLVRHYRAALLEREVRALPATASEASVDAASPLLGLFLRARLESAPTPNLGESITPYLTGLLVMLGLLGTLFGLFETVNGASRALTASADVSALRHSLSTPIAGLTRSFGCSAAGIGASAMLGLALALVRRREGRALRAVHAYAMGPLRVLAPVRRQARALEQLAEQGLTLPNASTALERVGAQLGELSTRLVALQSAGVEAQRQAFGELVTELRSELARAAAGAGSALQASIAPLLEQTIVRAGETTERQAAALSDIARDLTARLDADAAARRREVGELATTLGDVARELTARLDGDAAARREASAQHATALAAVTRDLIAQLEGDAEARRAAAAEQASALSGVARELVAQLDGDAAARRREAAEHAEAVAATMRELVAQLDADAAARRRESAEHAAALTASVREAEEARAAAQRAELQALTELAARTVREAEAREHTLDARWSALIERADQSAQALAQQEAERLLKLDGISARIGEELGRVAGALGEQLAQRTESERVHEQRSSAALVQLADNARAFEASIARQRESVEQMVAGLPPLFAEVGEAAQRGAAQALGQLVVSTEQRLSQIAELFDKERAGRLESERAHDERALAAMERMEQSSHLLDRNIAQQRELLDGVVERAGALITELAATARASAESTLARLADSAEEQAMRWAKLETDLAEGRLEHARGLEEQLTGHAERLERQLGEAGVVVHQAAEIWKASSAEMQAIAELFASSVERQREASDAWLESLGDIEAAVERSGRHAAADALADQLASTQEVFARQLQFQRELFEQLRTLRASGRSAGAEHEVSGGRDVSV